MEVILIIINLIKHLNHKGICVKQKGLDGERTILTAIYFFKARWGLPMRR